MKLRGMNSRTFALCMGSLAIMAATMDARVWPVLAFAALVATAARLADAVRQKGKTVAGHPPGRS